MIRACEQCGAELVRRAEEKPSQWARRRFCGLGCSRAHQVARSAAREVAASKRKCLSCGKPLVRKVYANAPEVITTFEKRQYCDLDCARARYQRPASTRPKPRPLVMEPPPALIGADTDELLRDAVKFHGEEFIRALEEATRPDASRTVPWAQHNRGAA